MRPPITSLQHPLIKEAVAGTKNRNRKADALFYVEGAREIGRALGAGLPLVRLFVCEEQLTPAARAVLVQAEAVQSAQITPVSAAVFAKLAVRDTADGLYAALQSRTLRLPPPPDASTFLVVVEAVEKPGNLGAILRSADGAGATGVVVLDQQVDPWHPQVIRASLGAVFTLPVYVPSGAEFQAWCSQHGLKTAAAVLDKASVRYDVADLAPPLAVVLGSEAKGLSPWWREHARVKVEIPMLGKVDSLNVAAACAVLCYEVRRRVLPRLS